MNKNLLHKAIVVGKASRSRMVKYSVLSLAALALYGCSNDGEEFPPPTPPILTCEMAGNCPDDPDKAEFGEECTRHSDCESGFCTTLTPSSTSAYCFVRCSEQRDCVGTDPASTCTSVTAVGGGFAQACVPAEFCADRDGDGYGEGPGCIAFDCDDSNPNIYPGAEEYCDGVDNNCNGIVDESPIDANTPCDTGLPGECSDGRWACVLGQRFCNARVQPGQRQEICDGADNDCDGKVDEGPDGFDTNFIVGLGVACGDAGSCFSGITVCDPVTRIISCDGSIEVTDTPDLCDYIDNNCDGQIDEDVVAPDFGQPCSVGIGTCRANGIVACVPNDPAATPVCNASPAMENATPEVCDYNDNDCDGQVDEGFVNSAGVYNTAAHCGSCNNNCDARWNPNPAAFGVASACTVQGNSASCTFTCLSGRVDLDGIQSNGCEFTPDLEAIYVASSTATLRPGVDSNTCGTWNAPCATIARALQRVQADSTKKRIRVSEGAFDGGFDLINGVSILGGHSSRNWTRDRLDDGTWINSTTLQGGKLLNNQSYAIRANAITSVTELSGFTIEAPDAQGSGNSIGIWVVNSNQNLTIEGNTILGGRGGAGVAGNTGSNGVSGQAGGRGNDRVNSSSSFSTMLGGTAGTGNCGGVDVSGSAGAPVTKQPSNSGEAINGNFSSGGNQAKGRALDAPGANAAAGTGIGGYSTWHSARGTITSGVHGCATNDGPPSPTAGSNGATGTDGDGGQGATNAQGSVSGGVWSGATGATGAAGTPGRGGGGGGSSGGARESSNLFHYGSTGGGGGAGGCQGTGGTGGTAGGASFGIFVTFASTPSANSVPKILGNLINRGQGGRGGQGGQAGVGGDGGVGGLPGNHTVENENWSRCGQPAAPGGAGGRGGHGGPGGGGAGGASYDIAVAGAGSAANSYEAANSYGQAASVLTGGLGGLPGVSASTKIATAGARGASGNFRSF